MDSKDLRTEPALSGRNNEGNKYAQSGRLQCDKNKSYQDIGSNSLGKVEVQNARPCAVIGPDRVVPPSATSEAYQKKGPAEPWPCPDDTYRRPPEYPHKLSNYQSPIRNISPRQTFQENMQRIMVPPTYNSMKINDDTSNYAQTSDRNIALSKNIKLSVPSEAKYCDVPYAVNLNNSEQKSVRNAEMCVSSVNSPLSRTNSHGWPPGSANLRSSRSYGAPELYQYQEYPSCAGPRPVAPRSNRNITDEPGYVYTDPYYTDGNIRFKPTYPPVKDRFPLTRYDYIGNYSNSFHPPPFPPQKYDLQKSMPHHPFPPYTPIKYLDNRVSEPVLDGYQRNQQGNMTYHNQVVHPNFSTIIGNCTPNKVHPFPHEGTGRTNVPNKTPYDNNSKTYDYDGRPKIYPPSDAYFVNEMARLHPMRGQVLMPNFPNLNMHAGPYNQYYKKENAQVKNYEYMSHYRNLDPGLSVHNPMMRYPPLYSPNTLPNDSTIGNDPNQTLGLSQEDCSYVSQSPSLRSIDSAPTRIPNDYYRRYYDSRYGHLVRPSGMMMKSELHSNNNTSKDKKNIDVRQFLQMWNEGDEETEDSNPKDIVIKTGSSNDKKLTKTHEVVNNQEQLYVLGLVNVPNEELSKYEHIQTVSKLPDNIKGYNSIELLDQFEEAIESSKINKLKSQNFNENLYVPMKGVKPKQFTGILPRPISPLDVEAKISQSVIHKEVGCNFEIKPCSPKMLNVEITTPVQNILAERVIEKVVNPGMMKSPMVHGMEQNTNCNLMKRQDLGLSMSENVRIPSCKMINTQFSSMNSIDPIKSSYSLHDLESNSGLCLASLPRLDNDIELNFPEVNQQFINDNKSEPTVSLSSLKDLPKLEVFNQSNIETKYNSNEIKVSVLTNNQSLNAITRTYKNQQSPSNTDTEKEFSKLSKFRKNKTNCPEELEKKPVVPEDQVQNAVRTDSVIIKNPENIKKYEENSPIFSPNCFDELQEAPMNLTSQVCFDINQKGNGVNNNYNKLTKESEYAAIAIDFSLNKNHLEDLKPTETETVAIETENVLVQDTEESNLNIDCVTNTLKVTTSSNRSLHSSEDDGQVSNNVITNCDVSEKLKIPAKDNNDKIIFDLNSDTNNSVEELSILNQNDSGKLTNDNNKENLNIAISGECTDTECEIKSENPEVEGPLREDKNDYSLINADNIDKDPLNKLGEKTNKCNNMEVAACETHNKDCIKNNEKLQISCNTDSSEIKPVKSIIMQVDTDKKINMTNVKNNSHASDIVLVSPVQIETCEQANQNSEMCIRSVNDNIREEKNEKHMMCVNPVQNEAGDEENLIEMVCPVENIVCDQTNFINEICVNPVQNEVCEQVHVPVPLDPNVATSNIQHSPTREDIKNNQINNESSKEDLNTRPNSPFTNSIGDSEAEANVKFGTADYNIQESQSEIKNKNPLVNNEESLSKCARQYLRIWSKEMFSPWIRKLLTFSEGNINILNNLETSMKNMPSKSTDKDIEKSLHFNKNLNDVDKCDKDLEVIDNEGVIAYKPPNLSNTINMCDSLDDLKFISDDRDNKINTDEHDLVEEKYLSDDNNLFISALSPNVESRKEEECGIKDDKNAKGTPSPSSVNIDSDMSTDQITVVKDSIVSTNTENLHETKDIMFFQDTSAVVETQNILSDEIKNDTGNLFLSDSIGKDEICNSFLKEGSKVVATFDENVIENQENTDGIQTMRKQRKPLLKRSLSDSALNAYGFNTKLNKQHEYDNTDNQSLWPVKRRKIDKPENVDQDILTQNLCSIIQHNRRNSFSAICNEDDVSFCILIDNSCIIADEENEEQKICYTELSGELEVQNESFNDEVGDNTVMVPATQSPQINTECEYSDSFTFDCEDKTLANSWVEDVACIETVISDDIAENIVISGPSSPKDIDFSDNDESGVFSSCEHTDKVKFIYGDKMCSDDALYLEALYNTPQMDVNKKLSRIGTQVVNESSKYYDNDSLEKILSESNGKESSTSEIMHSIQLLDVGNSNTPDDKENMNVEDFSLQNNLNSGDDVEDYIEKEILQPKLLLKTQDDTVHSCESSIDNVFSYKDDPKEDSNITSCSPEVSSTTSEDKGSSILLKITNYKGSRISQINKISSVINRPSCKFTEVNDYLHSHSNMSKNRPLLTKAAQKYIPPIKESIRDLKVKLTLPQHSLMKLKQLKKSKDEPKTIKQNTTISRILKKPKPKFEDVLMSIDEIQFQKHKEKTKKTKKSIPKVVIKKSQTGSHYASTSNNDHFNPDLTGRKWQPWIFLEKNHFIDKMASRNKTKAVYNHRKKCYVLLEKFKKYKSVYNTKFVISQPKIDNSSSGLKYTIRLKHNY